MQKPAIQVRHLTVNRGQAPVLWDIDFEVKQGSLTGVIGPNGAGKTTLLQTLVGNITPASGTIQFFGLPSSQTHKKVAYVPQRQMVDWQFPITVLDLALMGRYHMLSHLKWYRAEDKRATLKVLDELDIQHLASKQIGQLSGGQQQRAFIARALVQQPDLFLFDEPFTAVDALTKQVLIDLFTSLRNKGKTLLIVHHDLSSASRYFDHALLLNVSLLAAGPICHALTADNLARAYGHAMDIFDEATRLATGHVEGKAL